MSEPDEKPIPTLDPNDFPCPDDRQNDTVPTRKGKGPWIVPTASAEFALRAAGMLVDDDAVSNGVEPSGSVGDPYRELVVEPQEEPEQVYIGVTPKAVYALEAAERARYRALPWWKRLLQWFAHRRDPMNLENRS